VKGLSGPLSIDGVEYTHIKDEINAFYEKGLGYYDLWRIVATIGPDSRKVDWHSCQQHAFKLFEEDEKTRCDKPLVTHARVARAMEEWGKCFFWVTSTPTDNLDECEKTLVKQRKEEFTTASKWKRTTSLSSTPTNAMAGPSSSSTKKTATSKTQSINPRLDKFRHESHPTGSTTAPANLSMS
jgi:hypothetical protein